MTPSASNVCRLLGTALVLGFMEPGAAADLAPASSDRTVGVLDVRNFGTKGDGQTDDTAAIQRALDAAGVRGGGIVYVPGPATYLLSATLTIPSFTVLVGDQKERTRLKFTYRQKDLEYPAIKVAPNGYYQAIRDLDIEHVRDIDPTRFQNNESGTGVLLYWDGVAGHQPAQHTTIERVRIKNFQMGVRIPGASTWVTLIDVNAEFCGTGFSVTRANFTHFVRCISDRNQASWLLEGTTKAELSHCTAQYSYSTERSAIEIVGAKGTTISELWTEGNQHHGVELRDGSDFTRITEPLLHGSGWDIRSGRASRVGAGLFVRNVRGTLIDGGDYGDNGTADIAVDSSAIDTVVVGARAGKGRLSIRDSSTTTQWIGASGLNLAPSESGRIVLPGGTGPTMSRPPTGPSRVSGEIAGARAGAADSNDGFLRLSAGGGGSATEKTFVDLSGYSSVPDMNRTIVLGVRGVEKARIDDSGLRPGGGSSGPLILSGRGAPTRDAPIGSMYLRSDGGAGTSLYIKEAPGAGVHAWTSK